MASVPATWEPCPAERWNQGECLTFGGEAMFDTKSGDYIDWAFMGQDLQNADGIIVDCSFKDCTFKGDGVFVRCRFDQCGPLTGKTVVSRCTFTNPTTCCME